MKKLQNIILLSVATFTVASTTGCSSRGDVISISDTHSYGTSYGMVDNYAADRQIEEELVAMSLPEEIDNPQNMHEGWTTTLTKDKDAFYADEYVQKPEVITYKYKFDKKFYKDAEWRSAEF